MRNIYIWMLTLVLSLSAWMGTAVANEDWPTIYTMSNEPSGNAILAFRQLGDTLVPAGRFPTEGKGTGGGLGNQGALVLTEDGEMLIAVNPGSDDISVFRVDGRRLTLVDRVSSGGSRPISVTTHEDWVYVLNAGGVGNITGFELTNHDKLKPIPGSTRPLSGSTTAPAQIEFTPSGDTLVVTEKATQTIDTYAVDEEGITTGPVAQRSNGATPFGFSFTRRGVLIVSEAFGGAPNASAVSSYALHKGTFTLLSGSVPSSQTAACWIVITKNGKFAYASNTGSHNISSYRISRNGTLTLHEAVAASTGNGPIDMALSRSSRSLYVLNSASNSIQVFRVNRSNGHLAGGAGVSGLPTGTNGLVAR
ncbi:MAG: beta-propeller fold lactonase family protein [Nitrospira sp.]